RAQHNRTPLAGNHTPTVPDRLRSRSWHLSWSVARSIARFEGETQNAPAHYTRWQLQSTHACSAQVPHARPPGRRRASRARKMRTPALFAEIARLSAYSL